MCMCVDVFPVCIYVRVCVLLHVCVCLYHIMLISEEVSVVVSYVASTCRCSHEFRTVAVGVAVADPIATNSL